MAVPPSADRPRRRRLRTYPTRETQGAFLRLPVTGIDLLVLIGVALLLFAVARVGSGLAASFSPHAAATQVSTAPSELPYDAGRSLLRMFLALGVSTVFTLTYGYACARSRRAEAVLVPVLDVLQSVPILGFLTITVSGFIALFPGSILGLECAAIFAIFTSQAWNMAFSYYHSVKALPRELDELSRMLRLTRWQRYWTVETPKAGIDLVWNAMMAFGGGWFFLSAAEAVSVLNRNESLPGVGSYAAAAVARGEVSRMLLAVATMVLLVVGVNVLFWRPLTAWAERFRMEDTEAGERQRSLVLELLRRSRWPRLLGALRRRAAARLGRAMRVLGSDGGGFPAEGGGRRSLDLLLALVVAGLLAAGAARFLDDVASGPGFGELGHALGLGMVTLGRVVALLVVATLVWVPVGVWIGSSPRVTRYAQPVVQVLASFPANILFPFVTIALIHLGIGLDLGGILLMALGAQWYILFNVIAGAMAIPTDLREAMDSLGVRGRLRWRRLIVPAIFPAYVTGGITASGGAWNASIVAEVVVYSGTTLTATGLGAYIAHASAHGDLTRVLVGVVVMSALVVAINRVVWRRLYRLAEARYSLG